MRVGLMTPGFNPFDAIGNDVLGMRSALASRGDEVIIFTASGESHSPMPVMHYADAALLLDGPEDVLIYHYCVADPSGMAVLRRLSCRIFIRYHNVTPASLMSRWSIEFGLACKLGRALLADLPDMAIDGFIADSAYNAAELTALAIRPDQIRVVPPLHRCDELLGQLSDPGTERLLETSTYNVLAVGRLVPNKGFDLMVESFAKTLTWGSLDIRLHHVGTHDRRLQSYIDRIGEVLAANHINHRFQFHGQASSRVLATLYRKCDLFWITSLHEGFCVPAVEAMAFGRPILTSRSSALPETCGDAAVYATGIDETAVRLHELLADDFGLNALGRASRARYDAHFRPHALQAQFLSALDSLLAFSAVSLPASSLDRAGDWFGLPRVDELLDAALPLARDLPSYGLDGQDRRRDLVDWALRDGPSVSKGLAAYVSSPELTEYARTIEMPRPAAHLKPDLRLTWMFHRPARSRFDLLGPESVSDFINWHARELGNQAASTPA